MDLEKRISMSRKGLKMSTASAIDDEDDEDDDNNDDDDDDDVD